MSYSSVHERMTFHAFNDYDSSFDVFFNIFLFLLTIQFKGKKVLSYFIKLFNYSSLLDFLIVSYFEKLSSDLKFNTYLLIQGVL